MVRGGSTTLVTQPTRGREQLRGMALVAEEADPRHRTGPHCFFQQSIVQCFCSSRFCVSGTC